MRNRLVLVAALLAGCTVLPVRRTPVEPRPGTAKMPGDERTAAQPGIQQTPGMYATRKRVKAKEEPATLIADDNMRCTVNEKRFKDTTVGDYALCGWTK